MRILSENKPRASNIDCFSLDGMESLFLNSSLHAEDKLARIYGQAMFEKRISYLSLISSSTAHNA